MAQRRRANFFAHKARQHSDIETTNTTARPQQGNSETDITSAPENCTKNAHFSPAKAMTVSVEARPVPAKATRVSDKRAGRRLTTHGSHALQTSSNWSISKPSLRTRVTNVVNLSQKTSIFHEKGIGLTTFVTTTQESTQKTPRVDDVCNKTRRATDQRPSPTGVEGAGGYGRAWLRCPWAAAGPGRASTATRPHRCGGRRRDRRARAGFEARRRTK